MHVWTLNEVLTNINKYIEQHCCFPTQQILLKENRSDLVGAIRKFGGFNKIRERVGFPLKQRPDNYWNDITIVGELRDIIKKNGCLPSDSKLSSSLRNAIRRHGGNNKFRVLLGCPILTHSDGYWSEDNIIKKLRDVINKHGCIPSQRILLNSEGSGLIHAIIKNGGINKYRVMLEQPILLHNEWSYNKVKDELSLFIKEKGYFPMSSDLRRIGKSYLVGAIRRMGGFIYFQKEMGYAYNYNSALKSYVTKRGKNTEKIVFEILSDYCIQNKLQLPKTNTKLCKGNMIEFVCNHNKIIGIDVTNTRSKHVIIYKWTKKDYYKYLDELLIVVFSDVLSKTDYYTLNKISPDNVTILSIEDFCNKLQYTVDMNMSNIINKYKSCTFDKKNK